MKHHFSFRRRQRGNISSWVFAGFALVALFFLLTEHSAHLFDWLPFLLLAACRLMQRFHGGHGGHGRHGSTGGQPPRSDELCPPTDAPAKPDIPHHY